MANKLHNLFQSTCPKCTEKQPQHTKCRTGKRQSTLNLHIYTVTVQTINH